MTGTVERIVTDRAFGFLKSDEGRKSIFFHRSGTTGFYDLREGDRVSFDVADSDKGPRAENVALVEQATV
jgi:CspA family cold shock protein